MRLNFILVLGGLVVVGGSFSVNVMSLMVGSITHHKKLSTPFFSARNCYVWVVMRPFQKSKIELLKELRELIKEARQQHAERSLISERRFNRKMVLLRREIDRWVKELVNEEKLREQERQHNEVLRKQMEAAIAAHAGSDQ